MKTYRNGKAIQARSEDGSFRRFTGEDVGIGVCPQCAGITVQPTKPTALYSGFVDPQLFNNWRNARVCSCGWKNTAALVLESSLR
jgi:hypothetical protein